MPDPTEPNTPAAAPTEPAAGQQQDTALTGDAPGVETDPNAVADESAAAEGDAGDNPGETAEGEEGQNTPPETYADFDLPEGMELDGAALEQAQPLFKELGLTQDQAQKVVSFYADQIQAGQQRQADTFNQMRETWLNESMSNKEFGGDKFDESVGIAREAIEKVGSPELKTLLEESGFGNHPELIGAFYRMGKLMKEDVPGGESHATSTERSRVDILYPKKETA